MSVIRMSLVFEDPVPLEMFKSLFCDFRLEFEQKIAGLLSGKTVEKTFLREKNYIEQNKLMLKKN
jgi:hypothetical protein